MSANNLTVKRLVSRVGGGPVAHVVELVAQDGDPVVVPVGAEALAHLERAMQGGHQGAHALVLAAIGLLGAKLGQVVLLDQGGGRFVARLMLLAADREVEVASRASDALVLAVMCGCPIHLA
jgi:bifunctional DNase/RNase